MKFGASLSEGQVPEWKEQYLNYKKGKKIIHRVSDALSDYNQSKPKDSTPLLLDDDNNKTYVPDEFPQDQQDNSSRRKASVFKFLLKSQKDKKDAIDNAKANFMSWLQLESTKIDDFYLQKEKEIYERLLILEDQFYHLKDHQQEVQRQLRSNIELYPKVQVNQAVNGLTLRLKVSLSKLTKYELPSLPSSEFLKKWTKKSRLNDIGLYDSDSSEPDQYDPNYIENLIRNGNLEYVEPETDIDLVATDVNDDTAREQPQTHAQMLKLRRRDYTKRYFKVPYLYARKQLRTAIIEHYRLISLLKSYKSMNRTAFRKITKKFDKAVGTSLCAEFVEKIDKKSYFGTSDVLDKVLSRVEDLFLDFYDRGKHDRKYGLEKLKSATFTYGDVNIKQPQYYPSVLLTGIFFGFGIPIFILAVWLALNKTLTGVLHEGRYLLQIWAGFFLINLAFVYVGLTMHVFNHYKISYKFIFEFDMGTALDCKQFLVLPMMSFALLSVLAWFSFNDFWANSLPGRDFPIIYCGIMVIIFLWPGSHMFGASRKWLQRSLWRILWSGFYPVEFRDFYLGDILSSLTYPIGNLPFFFCLYGNEWKHYLGRGEAPSNNYRCDSSHSRLLGFFQTLPSIWRFMQCVRRYMDSGDEFPHLANMMKYLVGALYYALLSVWRIDRTSTHRAVFITFASINAVYTSIWDIVMDWSLGQINSKNFLLRDHLFYKRCEFYYAAMVIDVILRFQWVFYACFSSQLQQLAVTSFCIALAEITRRFIWMFFRMENEHCTNVVLFRASRDSPLPYAILLRVENAIKQLVELKYSSKSEDTAPTDVTELDLKAQKPKPTETIATNAQIDEEAGLDSQAKLNYDKKHRFGEPLARTKSTFNAILNALNRAHMKDFQRRKYKVLDEDSDDDYENDEDMNDIEDTDNNEDNDAELRTR